jgi:hypothetical protein
MLFGAVPTKLAKPTFLFLRCSQRQGHFRHDPNFGTGRRADDAKIRAGRAVIS